MVWLARASGSGVGIGWSGVAGLHRISAFSKGRIITERSLKKPCFAVFCTLNRSRYTWFPNPPHMALTPGDIARIAQLARLDLTDRQQSLMLGQINGFFDLVEQMGQVNTAGVEPLAHPIETVRDIALRLREDKATEPNEREANQQSAPLVERGLYLVPRVIE